MKMPGLMILLTVCLYNAGCSTITTINNSKIGGPKIFSGTRFNLYAIENDPYGMSKFHTTPPKHPLLDLPGSLMLDILFLPLTCSTSVMESVFYRY